MVDSELSDGALLASRGLAKDSANPVAVPLHLLSKLVALIVESELEAPQRYPALAGDDLQLRAVDRLPVLLEPLVGRLALLLLVHGDRTSRAPRDGPIRRHGQRARSADPARRRRLRVIDDSAL